MPNHTQNFMRGCLHGLLLSAWLWLFLYLGLTKAL